jgi:Cu(I)/Ag(I) efflux system membrane fusion protein
MTGREHRGATTDEKNVQAPGSVPAPAPGSTPESASLQQRLDDTVAAYLGLQRALAKDDLAAAEAAVTNLRSAADVLVIASDGDTRAAAQKLVAATPTAVERIEVLRDAFKAVSTAVVDLVHARHPSRAVAGAVRVAYCPMAKATWIQTEPDIANPYFGAAMPTCGSIRETLEATEPSKGGK